MAGDSLLWRNSSECEDLIDMNQGFGSSGFNALPAGRRGSEGYSSDLNFEAYFWTSTTNEYERIWIRGLCYCCQAVYRSDYRKGHGFSVRCVKD